jgi:hypothetical protein
MSVYIGQGDFENDYMAAPNIYIFRPLNTSTRNKVINHSKFNLGLIWKDLTEAV